MFSEMITALKRGRLPETKSLKKRLEFALTKKLGIIKQPYLLWPGDPKMNPPAAHILWAALILGDHASVDLAADILVQEHHEKLAAGSGSLKRQKREVLLQSAVQDLLHILPPNSLQSFLQENIQKSLG